MSRCSTSLIVREMRIQTTGLCRLPAVGVAGAHRRWTDGRTGGTAGLGAEHRAAAVEHGLTVLRRSQLPDGPLHVCVGTRGDTCTGMFTAAWTWRPQVCISRGVDKRSVCAGSRMGFGHNKAALRTLARPGCPRGRRSQKDSFCANLCVVPVCTQKVGHGVGAGRARVCVSRGQSVRGGLMRSQKPC